MGAIDISGIKKAFSVFDTEPELIYLDSASTALVPRCVSGRVFDYLRYQHANSGRGQYRLAESATRLVRDARSAAARFIGAESADTLAFCSSATEGINMVASGWLSERLKPGQNVVISAAEHHANLLPWQKVCKQASAQLRVVDLNAHGQVDLNHLKALVDDNTVLLAMSQVSNVLGVINDVSAWAAIAHKVGARLLVDASQAVAHVPASVASWACDFYVFSGHKLYAGPGCAVLYVCKAAQTEFKPTRLGGGIVTEVDWQQASFIQGIEVYEAGSPNIAAIVALHAAIDFIDSIGWQKILEHERVLISYLLGKLNSLDFVQPLLSWDISASDVGVGENTKAELPVLISFTCQGLHSHDLASLLNAENIALRAGLHCAQPLHKQLNVSNSSRVSLGLYNNKEDMDLFIKALSRAYELLAVVNEPVGMVNE
ncbi:aminotransferase class V-fold PLP-dependent enzyme [Agaribacterium sp. ZY112]|uniref:aminotransferase class V-fold PLP-dependent enzyme n=1 Tax=Agaribacterium sp. ZY112 TaxID=3233574 RepID=UPI0035237FFF